jgi:thiol-disulfide isomerase/thioredoxin
MSQLLKKSLTILAALALLLGALSCSQTQTARIEIPPFYSQETVDQVREHINQGYDILDSGYVDSAVAEFAKISDLVTTGVAAEYHTACAYGRSGNKEEAFRWLDQLVANGFDVPEQLREDGDFQSLTDDPRFDGIVQRATENSAAFEAALALGMPDYETAPRMFASEEEYDEWVDEQNGLIRSHRRVWTAGGRTLAKIDFVAQKLACLRELKADDPEFDYQLERVREATKIYSMYESWGPYTDLVMREVETYMGSSPSGDGLGEVNYRAGLALSMKYNADDSQRIDAYSQANTYLANVAEETDFYGAAQALVLVNQLRLPDADEETLGPELRRIVDQYAGDETAYRVISTQFGNDAVRLLWPIQLDLPDIDQKLVALDEYKGKALLIDFWATWCRPCRAELPNLLEVYEQYHLKGLEIVSISLDYADDTSPEDYRAWIDEHGMNWRHTYDGEGWDTEIVSRYYVSSIPAPFLVGPDGSLVAWGEDCRGENLTASVEKALSMLGS